MSLKEEEIMQLRSKGFPNVNLCYNYLTDNSENTKNGDLKLSDWQHVESQSLQPHLSNYKQTTVLIHRHNFNLCIYFIITIIIIFLRNAKFIDIMCFSVFNNSWHCSFNWCFRSLSTSNKCNFSDRCYVSSCR